MTETWRPVPGWEGYYAISDMGRVKSLARSVPGRPGVLINKRERLLASQMNASGYLQVWLCRDNRRSQQLVHRLVLLAFAGACPDGQEGCHGDGDKTNNAVANLRWDTRSANTHDKVRHGTHPMAARTHCPAGHPYDDDNTYTTPTGSRMCRRCRAEKKRARRAAERTSR